MFCEAIGSAQLWAQYSNHQEPGRGTAADATADTAAMRKTALITGITGQDGSYLAEFLLDKGGTTWASLKG